MNPKCKNKNQENDDTFFLKNQNYGYKDKIKKIKI
jgi:hypothetical protein